MKSGQARLANVFTRAAAVKKQSKRVRELKAYGLTLAAIATRFGVSDRIIKDILRRKK